MMKLTLIRHGDMSGDPFICPERPVKGCLSEELGIPQAKATAEALKNEKFDFAFSSPYGRALQTAEIVLEGRDIDIQIMSYMHEWIPNPELVNLPSTVFEDIQRQAENAYAEETWKTDLGEGTLEMCARIIPAFLKDMDRIGIHSRWGGFVPENDMKDCSVVVFAHGGSLGTLLSFLLGVKPFPVGSFSFEHTGVAVIEFVERKGVYYPKLNIPALHPLGRS